MNKLTKSSSIFLLTVVILLSSIVGFLMGRNDRNQAATPEYSQIDM